MDWIGYWIDYQRFGTGLIERRAQWIVNWLDATLLEGGLLIRVLREVLGRLGHALAALEWYRPLLGPVYAWVHAVPAGAYLKLPVLIRLIFEFLSDELKQGNTLLPVPLANERVVEWFRADAHAAGDEIGIGGWECLGGLDTKEARWFSIKLNRRNAPWAFRSGEPFRTIASLELLGTLLSVMVFGEGTEPAQAHLVTISGTTDNRGNSFAVARLLTTKFPLIAFLMALSALLARKGWLLDLSWVPRGQNCEADELSNGIFRRFDPAKRIEVDLERLQFILLDKVLTMGESLFQLVEEAKAERKRQVLQGEIPARPTKEAKVSRDMKLRVTDPW